MGVTLEENSPGTKAPERSQQQSEMPGRSRSIAIVVFVTLVAIALILGGRAIIVQRASSAAGADPEPPMAVAVKPVVRAMEYIESSYHIGLVEPRRQTDLAFESGGTLIEVLVEEGALVNQGDVIARLDTRALDAQIAAQNAMCEALISDLERAQLAFERQRSLQARDFAVEQSLDDARLLVTRTQALIEQCEAAVSAIEVSLDKAILKAPFGGSVGVQPVDVGSTVNAGTLIARLLEAGDPYVRIGVPVELADVLLPDSVFDIDVDGTVYSATVVSSRKDLSARTRSVIVRLRLDTTDRKRPVFGQTAKLKVLNRIAQQGYRVPVDALIEGEAGLWSILLSLPDEPGSTTGRVVREHVDIVYTDGVFAYISATLPEDAGIIHKGPHRIVAGQRVRGSVASQ